MVELLQVDRDILGRDDQKQRVLLVLEKEIAMKSFVCYLLQ